jgi:hypothetical protein
MTTIGTGTFTEWVDAVRNYTLPQLRFEVPPTSDLLELTDRFGLEQWEHYVLRLERNIVKNHWTFPW